MHGGLWEWTADAWHPDYQGAPVEGQVWSQGGEPNTRVVRGGSWHDPADICRSAIRLRMRANEGDDIVGLRVACDLPNSEGP